MAPPVVISGGMVLRDLVAQLESAVESLLSNLGNEARFTAFVVGQELRTLIDSFLSSYETALDRTFDRLDESVKNAVINLNQIVSQVLDAVAAGLEDLGGLADTIESAIARLPGADTKPRLRRFEPTFFPPLRLGEPLILRARGVLLKQGPAALTIVRSSTGLVTWRSEEKQHTDSSVEFKLYATREPADVDRSRSTTEEMQAGLGLDDIGSKEVRLEYVLQLTHVLRGTLWSSRRQVKYHGSLLVLPRRFGTITVHVTVSAALTQEELRRSHDIVLKSHGDGDTQSDCVAIRATQGWVIDIQRIRWVQHYRDNADFFGIRHASESGFCVALQARGKGLFNGRGAITGHAEYYEKRETIQDVSSILVHDMELRWGEDISLRLPSGTKNFSTTVTTYWGEKRTIVGSNRLPYLSIEQSPGTNLVVIRLLLPGSYPLVPATMRQ